MNKFYTWCYGSTFVSRARLPELRPFPLWAKSHPGWHYCGRDDMGIFLGRPFKERVKEYNQQDHGERRKMDIYKEGAVFWCKEPGPLVRLWQRFVCFLFGHNRRPLRAFSTVFPPNICRCCGARLCE